MTEEKFKKLDALSMGDSVTIHFSDSTVEVAGVEIETPLETTVKLVDERRLDQQKGHDVEGIVTKKEIYIEPPAHDNVHGEYVIRTESPLDGEKSVSPIEGREYREGRPGDGTYAINLIGFSDIEIRD